MPIEVTFGGKKITAAEEKFERMSMLLWGHAGGFKTTLAETAPGEKLWLNFDPNGMASLQGHREKVHRLDFSGEKDAIVAEFVKENPLGLKEQLQDNPQIETVVFDSLTTFGDLALGWGVESGKNTTKGKSEGTNIYDPGFTGWGRKHTVVYQTVISMLRLTANLGRHLIFIAHENPPEKDSKGIIQYITLMLGSSLVEQVPVRISEIWNCTDVNKERRIATRPARLRKPMRTRMFQTNTESEFVWKYDADTDKGDGIREYYNRWKANGFAKIPLPKG